MTFFSATARCVLPKIRKNCFSSHYSEKRTDQELYLALQRGEIQCLRGGKERIVGSRRNILHT